MQKIFEQLSDIGIAQAKIIKDLQERVSFLEDAFLVHTRIIRNLVDGTNRCTTEAPGSNRETAEGSRATDGATSKVD